MVLAAFGNENDEGAKQLCILVQNSCLNWFYKDKYVNKKLFNGS